MRRILAKGIILTTRPRQAFPTAGGMRPETTAITATANCIPALAPGPHIAIPIIAFPERHAA